MSQSKLFLFVSFVCQTFCYSNKKSKGCRDLLPGLHGSGQKGEWCEAQVKRDFVPTGMYLCYPKPLSKVSDTCLVLTAPGLCNQALYVTFAYIVQGKPTSLPDEIIAVTTQIVVVRSS